MGAEDQPRKAGGRLSAAERSSAGTRGTRVAIAFAIVLAMVAVPTAGAAAKKKGGGSKPFQASLAPNAAIPDSGGALVRSTPLRSAITVPKKYKGNVVGDVNVTGLQTTGSDLGAANDLLGYLIAPSGRTLQLFFGIGDQSLGPWTMDDDTSTSICNAIPPAVCQNADQTLLGPFAGTANLDFNWGGNFPVNGTLSIFNGVKMKGPWTLLLTDAAEGAANGTSTLNRWGLKITPAKPVKK
jgi:hypothetical protein